MGWRKQMGISELKSPIQKVQNIQKPPEQIPFVPIVPFVYRESKTKTDQTPPPDLSKIQPGHTQEYITLWYQACELEAYTSSEAPYPERVAKLPELNRMVERMRVLEDRTKAAISSRPVKKIPGLPDDLFQAPAVWKPV